MNKHEKCIVYPLLFLLYPYLFFATRGLDTTNWTNTEIIGFQWIAPILAPIGALIIYQIISHVIKIDD